MKLIVLLSIFLASCVDVNQDNSVQVGEYRIAHDPSCMNASAQVMWYIIIPVLVIVALYTYIKNNR